MKLAVEGKIIFFSDDTLVVVKLTKDKMAGTPFYYSKMTILPLKEKKCSLVFEKNAQLSYSHIFRRK